MSIMAGLRLEQQPEAVAGHGDGDAFGHAEAVDPLLDLVGVDQQQVVERADGQAEAGEVGEDVQWVVALLHGLGQADARHVARLVVLVAVPPQQRGQGLGVLGHRWPPKAEGPTFAAGPRG
jgi:hypothetical protein